MNQPAKILALLLLIALSFQQETPISASADVSEGNSGQLPKIDDAPSTRSASGIISSAAPQAPSNWDFLRQDTSLGAKWIGPSTAFDVKPLGYVATYSIEFHTDCPQNPVTLKFSVTGSGFVYLNGKSVLQWASPYPKLHTVTLKVPELQCGCNTIKIYVYNYYFASPAALLYNLYQDTVGCYDC